MHNVYHITLCTPVSPLLFPIRSELLPVLNNLSYILLTHPAHKLTIACRHTNMANYEHELVLLILGGVVLRTDYL